jgi:nicotinamide-nucleotide amidase
VSVLGPDGGESRALRLSGGRAVVRERSVTYAMQLLRALLLGGPPA